MSTVFRDLRSFFVFCEITEAVSFEAGRHTVRIGGDIKKRLTHVGSFLEMRGDPSHPLIYGNNSTAFAKPSQMFLTGACTDSAAENTAECR